VFLVRAARRKRDDRWQLHQSPNVGHRQVPFVFDASECFSHTHCVLLFRSRSARLRPSETPRVPADRRLSDPLLHQQPALVSECQVQLDARGGALRSWSTVRDTVPCTWRELLPFTNTAFRVFTYSVLLVGTRMDERSDASIQQALKVAGREPVSTEAGVKLAKELGAVGYLECSALTQQGVNDVFNGAMRQALQYKRRNRKAELAGCMGCSIM